MLQGRNNLSEVERSVMLIAEEPAKFFKLLYDLQIVVNYSKRRLSQHRPINMLRKNH